MLDTISTLQIFIPALPLAAAGITALLGPWLRRTSPQLVAVPVVAGIIGSFIAAMLLLANVAEQQNESVAAGGYEHVATIWTWAGVPHDTAAADPPMYRADGLHSDLSIEIALRADALTAVMLAMVTFVSSLVAIFSIGYMQGDRGYWRFFSYIGLFVFSMTMLVSASNFLLLFVFWEAVGLCSYLLIGFWYEKPAAAAAGKKAFLVNRVGDFGFLLAIFLMWTYFGTLNFHTPSPADSILAGGQVEAADRAGSTTPKTVTRAGMLSQERIEANDYRDDAKRPAWLMTAICLLLLLGACGKSAQFPLHIWLPDAMEGPTPVSALIHAATMVTAGVYMVARCTPLFMASPTAQLVVAIVGGFTALLAALIALTQYDLKRVLAYSTVSQLGYMFLGLGTGTLAGISAGMFHLFTHAFFKALLFLGAGSVMHAMGNVIDMRQFGGLRRRLPITHWTFLIGCLALAGVPPLAGFWSKDSIVGAVHDKAHALAHAAEVAHTYAAESPASTAGQPAAQLAVVYDVLYYVALVTALLTAFYTFRAYFLTFHGEERIPPQAGSHAHESPLLMWAPLAVLAVCAALAGVCFDFTYLKEGTHRFAEFLASTPSFAAGAVTETAALDEFHTAVAAVSAMVALAGIGLAGYFYLGESRQVDRLTSLANFEWLIRLAEPQTASAWRRIGWLSAVDRFACRWNFGWLVGLMRYVVLLVLIVLAAPLLVGYFISPYRLSRGKFFCDELYAYAIVLPLRFAAAISYWIDRWIIDGLVNLVGRIPPLIGALMRSLQMGLVQFYALAMVLGALILIATKMLWAG